MTEMYFEERKGIVKDVPIIKLELTIKNELLQKYDIIKIGTLEFICTSNSNKTDGGFKYQLLPINVNRIITLIDTALPEL